MSERKPFIVAEMSANHLGTLSRALELVDAAAHAGADAIKLQTWSPGKMAIDDEYTIASGPWAGRTLAGLYDQAFTPWEWHSQIFERARSKNLVPFASVFDRPALQFLEDLRCPMYKIASFELVDLDLIRAAAGTGKPVVLSTGMATQAEIGRAVQAAHDGAGGRCSLTLLKCTSAYPAPTADANLAQMSAMRALFDCAGSGLSDHTTGIGVPIVAAANGADMIEKHLTLRRMHGGPDAAFSLEPEEFQQMVIECRRVVSCLGTIETMREYGPKASEAPQLGLRRSLHWKHDLPAGHVITEADLVTARPATGEAPYRLHELVGWRLPGPVQGGKPVIRGAIS